MKKISTLIFSASLLLLTSANAVTVIQRDGSSYQTHPTTPQPAYKAPTSKEYYDSLGRYQGRSEKHTYSNRTDHYDSLGRSEGYSEKNPYSYDGEVTHYDSKGRYQGSTRER